MATYACSDLHARLDLFKKIQSFLQPDDIVYFLGDAADRGPDGWQLIKEIVNDSRFIYLKGNHEDMLIKAADDYFKYDYLGEAYNLLVYNGGESTFQSLILDEFGAAWINYLRKLPTHEEYTNINGQEVLLSHAGYNPALTEEDDLLLPNEYELMWNRDHYVQYFDINEFNNCIIVHGHTPIPHLAEDLGISVWTKIPGPLWYEDKHKVCIDNGAFVTGAAYLLNLDTWESHTITTTHNKNN